MHCAGWVGLVITNQETKAEQRAVTCAPETQQSGTGSTVVVFGVFFHFNSKSWFCWIFPKCLSKSPDPSVP